MPKRKNSWTKRKKGGGGTSKKDKKKRRGEEVASPEFQGDEGKRESHPLLIPQVIEAVISNLCGKTITKNIRDFRNIRLVCSNWNQEANKMYRDSGREVVFGGTYYDPEDERERERMEKFNRDMKGSFDCPINKIKFGKACFEWDVDMFPFRAMLELPSTNKWLKSLTLEIRDYANFDFYDRDFGKYRLGELEELSFQCGTTSKMEMSHQSGETVNLLETLLRGAVNLKTLDIQYRSQIPVPEKDPYSDCAKGFGNVILTTCPKNVKCLRLGLRLTEDQVLCLLKMKLPLISFAFDIRQSIVNAKAIQQ